MARIPTAANINGPASMRPSGLPAIEDASGLERGIQNLGAGVRDLGANINQIDQRNRQRQNVADISAAEAAWLKGSLDIENTYGKRTDFEAFGEEIGAETEALKQSSAELIRDPVMRQRWTGETELKRLRVVDAVNDRGRVLSEENDRVNFVNGLEANAALISDPSVADDVRENARRSVLGALLVGSQTGLISATEGEAFRETYLEKANNTLALNRAKLQILQQPGIFSTQDGISTSMGGLDAAAAASVVSNGKVQLDPSVAANAAALLGDEAFPDDPELQAAYLSDPEVNAQYTGAAMNALIERYDGDMSAAVIASKGGTALADAWVATGKKDALLPEDVKTYYKKVIQNFAPEADYADLPVLAGPGVDLGKIDAAVLDRFEKVQGIFGSQLQVISGYRDEAHNKAVGGADQSMHLDHRALDIDVSKLSEAERIRFIETASAAGFTGIGVYKNSIHIDTGTRRAWGPSHGSESVPGWAQEVIDRHTSGQIVDVAPKMAGVADPYRDLDFEQRLALHQADQQAVAQKGLDMRASIDVAVQNAPAAIMQSGTYDGAIPTANQFVEAYGAQKGIPLFKQFDASMDVAQAAHGMQTMSAEEINAMVAAARPTSTGDSAAVQAEKFAQISSAAEQTMKARAEDPAGYTMQAFPNVAEVFAAIDQAGDDSGKQAAFSNALTMMSNAQAELGIEKPALLPKGMAESVAATFNDVNQPQAVRMGAVTGMVLATGQEDQQEAIMDQLIASGVPPNTEAAMAALVRGDSGSAAYLFRAAMTDATKLPLPSNVTESSIETRIDEMIFDEDEIGDVIYGLSYGTAENLQRVASDRALIESAVRLRLADKSAGNVEDAIRLTVQDMYGDVKVDIGGNLANVRITLPKDEDPAPLHQGFDTLLPTVGDALMSQMTPALSGATTSTGEAQILAAARDNYVSAVLEEGYFTQSGDGYVFIDPMTGSYVPGPDGEPLTFTRDQVLQAGINQPAPYRPPGQNFPSLR